MSEGMERGGGRREAGAFLALSLLALPVFALWLYSSFLHHAPGTQARALRAGEVPAAEELAAAIEALETLPFDLRPGETAHDLANLRFRQAIDAWPPTRGDLEALREEYVEALSLVPARPYAWARLAYVEQGLGAAPERVIQLLRQSIYIGPAEPVLALWRLRLAALLRPWWDDDFAALLPRQAAAAWNGPSRALVELALDGDLLDVARDGLRRDPEQLERFDALLERALSRRERQGG